MVSTPHHCFKTSSLEQRLGAGKARETHIPRAGEGGEPLIAWVQVTASGGHGLSSTFSSTPPLVPGSYNLP